MIILQLPPDVAKELMESLRLLDIKLRRDLVYHRLYMILPRVIARKIADKWPVGLLPKMPCMADFEIRGCCNDKNTEAEAGATNGLSFTSQAI